MSVDMGDTPSAPNLRPIRFRSLRRPIVPTLRRAAREEDLSALRAKATAGAFQTILASADENSIEAIVALSRELQGIVFFNEQRGAVQILDCSRSSVISSLQVSDVMIAPRSSASHADAGPSSSDRPSRSTPSGVRRAARRCGFSPSLLSVR